MMVDYLKCLILSVALLTSSVLAKNILLINELNYPPFSTEDAGLSLDIVEAAYKAVDINVNFNSAPFARLVKMVESGEALAGFNIIREDYAEDQFIFPKSPIYSVTTQYYHHTDHPLAVNNNQTFKNKSLRVGDVIGFMYNQAHLTREFNHFRSNTEKQLLDMLIAKRLDAAYITKEVVCYLGKSSPKYLKKLSAISQFGQHQVDLYLAFNKQHLQAKNLAALFERGLNIIKSNGTYHQLVKQHLGEHCI